MHCQGQLGVNFQSHITQTGHLRLALVAHPAKTLAQWNVLARISKSAQEPSNLVCRAPRLANDVAGLGLVALASAYRFQETALELSAALRSISIDAAFQITT
jgi:hypothetical protein